MSVFHQVNKILTKRNVLHRFLRFTHSEQSATVLYPLKSRKLLKIKGDEAPVFLQGLITNDMRHFEDGAKSMYAMFLNNKGRVLFDTLIHKAEGNDSFLLECDENVLNTLQKHLKIYKLKRNVTIEDVNHNLKLWALTSTCKSAVDLDIKPECNINIYKDPRLADLGFRVLSDVKMDGSQIAKKLKTDISVQDNEEGYRYMRYQLGVSEGAEDLPPGTSFPLEVNCDYLHGVSFHKGCYIGQEVTARVHHTGVVRKRIMPLKFCENINEKLEKDSVITARDKPKLNLGKLKGFVKDHGIGLIKIKEAFDEKILKIGNVTVEVYKPSWWPVEAPKEKVLNKTE